jgi:hypothetical protein
MRCRVALALVTALTVQVSPAVPPQPLTLELRVFNGGEEVTAHIRTTLHRPGEHGEAILQASAVNGRVQYQVAPGIYDVQVIQERDGRVLEIRWANRLVVMPYPDEPGHHLEVINFKSGYGALQVRASADAKPDVAIYEPGKRDRPAAAPLTAATYQLFVLRAGAYDVLAKSAGKSAWHVAIDVPLDRTRLWIVPEIKEPPATVPYLRIP